MALIDCPECGKQVSSNAPTCPNCGAPIAGALSHTDHEGPVTQATAEVAGRSETQAKESRKVSGLLVAGIVVMPYVFAWFTLRKGHSTKARAMSFAWLALFVVGMVGQEMEKEANRDTATREALGETTRAPVAPPPEPPEPKWYEGGTLHKAKVPQWVSATERNRVATCADFAATFIMNKSSTSLQRAYDAGVEFDGHDGGMKYAAGALCVCMNEATTDLPKKAQSQTISDMAAMCVILMDAQL